MLSTAVHFFSSLKGLPGTHMQDCFFGPPWGQKYFRFARGKAEQIPPLSPFDHREDNNQIALMQDCIPLRRTPVYQDDLLYLVIELKVLHEGINRGAMGQLQRKGRPALRGMSFEMRIDFKLNMHVTIRSTTCSLYLTAESHFTLICDTIWN